MGLVTTKFVKAEMRENLGSRSRKRGNLNSGSVTELIYSVNLKNATVIKPHHCDRKPVFRNQKKCDE